MRHRLYSINVLVSAGFILVALPLVLALLSTHTQMGQVASTTGDAFSAGVAAARDSRIVTELLTAFERNARQYRVVREPQLLALVQQRRARLHQVLDALDAQLPAPSPQAVALRRDLDAVVALLADDAAELDPAVFERMQDDARALAAEVNALIDAEVAGALQRVRDTRSALLYRAAALVPLAAAIGLLFALAITRPIRGLGRAIRQLGAGDYQRPVAVRGTADVQELGRQLDWLRGQLAEVESEKARFLRHVSHELKTPLANIREGSELLLDGSTGPLAPDQAEVAAILCDNGVSLQKSIENLLNFNAWQDKNARLVRAPVDVATMVQRVVDAHRLECQRRGVRVEAECAARQLWLDGDKVEVMLDNLVSNAVKFSPDGGVVRIRVRGSGRDAVIEVTDDGPGVPAAERSRVFDAFFQGGRPQRGHVKGTGIGLSVVRECARMHGGNAEVVTGEHDGGHFRVTLADALGA